MREAAPMHSVSVNARLTLVLRRGRWLAALMVTVMTILAAVAPAQAGRGAGHQVATRSANRKTLVDRQVERLTKRLDLNQKQQFAVRRILEHERLQIAGVWDDASIEPIARTYKLRDLQDDTVKQIRAVLNDEQRKKYMRVPEHKAGNSETLQSNYNKYVGAQ